MIKKFLAMLLLLALMLPVAVACGNTEDASESNTSQQQTGANTDKSDKEEESPLKKIEVTEEFKDGKLSIDGVDISKFVIVIPTDAESRYKIFAKNLAAWIKAVTNHEIAIKDDSAALSQHEIIVGSTNRPESESASGDLQAKKAYKAVLENGKLAINFRYNAPAENVALNALIRAFANNGCNITEGFTNNNLSLEEIQGLVSGALRTEIKDGGLYVHRSTEGQIEAWRDLTASHNDWTKKNPSAATGIQLDFETDSSYIYLKRSIYTNEFVLLVNNKVVSNSWSGTYYEVSDEDFGKVNRFTILMSNLRDTFNWSIQALEIDGACKIKKHKTDLNMLFLGDSITEGFNCNKQQASTYTFYTSSYFNANAVVQGYGSSQCWTEIIDPALANFYQPDVIIIAMGTNDYGSNRGQSKEWFKNRMDAFLDAIEAVYPDVPIIGVTPLRRLISMDSYSYENNYDKVCVANANGGYAEAYREHGATVVDGETLLIKTSHYADVLHPNEVGFTVYGENLCKAIEKNIEQIKSDKNN